MRRFSIILFLIFTIVSIESCKKDTPPTAIIYVVDVNRQPVEGATVEVYSAPSGSIIQMRGTTDEAGKVEFVTEEEYVLTAKAQKEVDGEILTGTATVVFKYNEVFEKTIVIK